MLSLLQFVDDFLILGAQKWAQFSRSISQVLGREEDQVPGLAGSILAAAALCLHCCYLCFKKTSPVKND